MALQIAPTPSQSIKPTTRQASLYRFYLLQADDHIARRREDYFTDDARAMAAAKSVMGDYPYVEIWCERRKVITLSRDAAEQLRPRPKGLGSDRLINRNQRLLQQAARACGHTEALRARPVVRQHSAWATLAWQQHCG
jgi:hypothetical protein